MRQNAVAVRARGFTLIELLVVVAVISILVAMVMPSMVKAMTSAMTASCKSSLRQIGQAVQMYKQNNLNCFLRHGQIRWQDDPTWAGNTLRPISMLHEYLDSKSEVWICAADGPTKNRGVEWYLSSFTCNGLLNGISDAVVRRPSLCIAMMCGPDDGGWIELQPPWTHDDTPYMHPTWAQYNRHDGQFNALYYDYHVELHKPIDTGRDDFEYQ